MFIKAPSPPLPPTDRGEETERGMVGGGGPTPGLDNASLAILDGPSCGVSPNGDFLPPPPPCAAGKKGRLVLAERERAKEEAEARWEKELYGKEGERVCGGGKGKESRAAASTVCTVYREGKRGKGPEGLPPPTRKRAERDHRSPCKKREEGS